jgi:hypothetical protein
MRKMANMAAGSSSPRALRVSITDLRDASARVEWRQNERVARPPNQPSSPPADRPTPPAYQKSPFEGGLLTGQRHKQELFGPKACATHALTALQLRASRDQSSPPTFAARGGAGAAPYLRSQCPPLPRGRAGLHPGRKRLLRQLPLWFYIFFFRRRGHLASGSPLRSSC